MRRAILCLALSSLAACDEKPVGPPPAVPILSPEKAAEAAHNEDVQNFLNGMLITSNVPVPSEPLWPAGPDTDMHWYWVKPSLKWGWGIETPEQYREAIEKQLREHGDLDRSDLWLRQKSGDRLSVLPGWRRLIQLHPEDCEAANELVNTLADLSGPAAALQALEKADPVDAPPTKQKAGCSRARFFSNKALLYLRNHQLDEAMATADDAEKLDVAFGPRTKAKVLLAMGKKKEALAQAELVFKMPTHQDWGAAHTLGLAQQVNGKDEDAKRTWSEGLARWPKQRMLTLALAGPPHSIFEWEEIERKPYRRFLAKELAFCGGFDAQLGLPELSAACYREAERLEPGTGLARQLAALSVTKPDEALEKLTAVTKPDSMIELKTALGWVLLRQKRIADAKIWTQRALDEEPRDPKAMQLMWQICGEEKDYVCLIEYRRLLGLPTHFNVEQYKDAAKAFEDQAKANGAGLSAKEPASTDAPKPPPVKELVLVPMGERVPPELDSIEKPLKAWLPGVKVIVAEREDLPAGVYSVERDKVIWEKLLERLRDQPGVVYVIEGDLAGLDSPFSFVRFDMAHARAVVSLSRLRSLTGKPMPAGTTLDSDLMPPAQRRLGSLVLGTMGTLLGLSHPCNEQRCVMRERRSVTDLTVARPPFCANHIKELAQIAAGVRAVSP